MSKRLQNYIRTFRKRAGLSQKEVAFLLGCRSGSKVSRYERFSRQPTLLNAFACEVLFDMPLHELFAGTYGEAVARVRKRARALRVKMEKQAVSHSKRKRAFVDGIANDR
jgi:transcriptional regulator with XRE-family HTH domain